MIRHRSAFAAVIFLVLGSVSAFAQTQIRFVEYSAKFLCGVVDVQSPAAAAVRPGIYETSINIHNPQLPVTPLPSVTFVKKVVVALPEGEKPIPPSQFRRDVLQADFAEQVDCKIIRGMLGPAGAARTCLTRYRPGVPAGAAPPAQAAIGSPVGGVALASWALTFWAYTSTYLLVCPKNWLSLGLGQP